MLYSHIMRMLRLGYCFLALFAFAAAAQSAEVIPPNPTAADEVFLRISGGFFGANVTQTGNHFRLDLMGCAILCPGVDVSLGTLPAGTYTYEVFSPEFPPPPSSPPVASGTFIVAPAALNAPTLSPAALAALCLILVGAGVFFIGRQT
jgi:hypothetical protein